MLEKPKVSYRPVSIRHYSRFDKLPAGSRNLSVLGGCNED